MTSILTGDVIHSRRASQDIWLLSLIEVLNKFGDNPRKWEIYRGDSFQLEVEPKDALEAAIYIKSALKKIDKNLDVRISIGIGNKDYISEHISMSNGTAFINSGESFETIKKQTLAFKTPWKEFDEIMAVISGLVAFQIENWSPNIASIVNLSLGNSNLNQIDLANKAGKKQSQISRELKKAGFDEITKAMEFYKNKILQIC